MTTLIQHIHSSLQTIMCYMVNADLLLHLSVVEHKQPSSLSHPTHSQEKRCVLSPKIIGQQTSNGTAE